MTPTAGTFRFPIEYSLPFVFWHIFNFLLYSYKHIVSVLYFGVFTTYFNHHNFFSITALIASRLLGGSSPLGSKA